VTVRITESRIPAGWLSSELGQAYQETGPDGTRYALVSYLTSPLRVNTIHEYVVFVEDGDADEYRWTIEPPGGPPIRTETTTTGWLVHFFTTMGTHEVRVEVVDGGDVVATLLLLQVVTTSDSALEQHIVDRRINLATADELRELRTDFGAYIQQASNLTGLDGIPSRLVSLVVHQETLTAPKWGSIRAFLMKKAGQEPRLREVQHNLQAYLYEEGKPVVGSSPFLARLSVMPRTLGPGQIGQWRVASLEGWIEWRENPTITDPDLKWKRKGILFKDVGEFMLLPWWRQIDCFNLCRFPKSNIELVAKLLARLKNRDNRWPDVLKQDVMANSDLLDIVLTEYRNGPSLTPAADAVPDYMYAGFRSLVLDPPHPSMTAEMPPALFP